MTELAPWMGGTMLVALGLGTVLTGLPIWTLLIGVASLFALLAVATGVAQWEHLGAVGARVLGVLDNDLLQALPLYMLVGVLLQYLPIGKSLLAAFGRLAARTGAGEAVAVLGVGAIIAPMNGSVASSSAMLSRLVPGRFPRQYGARALALVAAAGTIGVVVPPSLVLLLLGDALMRAHTEATHWSGWQDAAGRILNTQDLLHAVLLPALGIGALWLLWVLVAYRSRPGQAAAPVCTRRQGATAVLTVAAVGGLLYGVFAGYFFAVEAAAAGALALVVYALASRSLDGAQWRELLWQAMGLSGALLALLVGATVFSMVLRLWGTDAALAQWLPQAAVAPRMAAAMLLLAVALCAWVLDAFELIFVVVPILAPALVFLLQDAQQAGVLLLLVLQLSFLLPPLGYAVMMARAHLGDAGLAHGLLRHLLPFVGAQALAIGAVLAFPQLVHQFDPPVEAAPTVSDEDIARQMLEMSAPVDEAEPVDKKP